MRKIGFNDRRIEWMGTIAVFDRCLCFLAKGFLNCYNNNERK